MVRARKFSVRLQRAELIPIIRDAMEHRIQLPSGIKRQAGPPSDANCIDFALAICSLVFDGDTLLIHRTKFLASLEQLVNEQLPVLEAMTADQRRAHLELLVASQAKIGAYDTSAPLRAVPPKGHA